jgi:hypothetical protein
LVVSGETLEPLEYVPVPLFRCDGASDPSTCGDWAAYPIHTDSRGAFRFTNDDYGYPLREGSYLVHAYY